MYFPEGLENKLNLEKKLNLIFCFGQFHFLGDAKCAQITIYIHALIQESIDLDISLLFTKL